MENKEELAMHRTRPNWQLGSIPGPLRIYSRSSAPFRAHQAHFYLFMGQMMLRPRSQEWNY